MKHTFTDDEVKTIHAAAHAVWQYIGGDILTAVAEEKSKPIEKVTIPRNHVVELVCDADRLGDQLKKQNPELAKKVAATDYTTVLFPLVKKGFTYARYGL